MRYVGNALTRKRLLIMFVACFAFISITVILFITIRDDTYRALRGHWVEYSDSEYLTTLEFTRNEIRTYVYMAFERVSDRSIPFAPVSGRPWRGKFPTNERALGDDEVPHIIQRINYDGAFSVVDNRYLVLSFSDAPPGREFPHTVATVEFIYDGVTLTLTGHGQTVVFVRSR